MIKKSDVICSYGSSLELFSSFYGKKTISFFKTLWVKFNIVDYPKNYLDLKKNFFRVAKVKVSKNKLHKIFKIIYYLNTFGEKFKFFKPMGHSRGLYKNTKINHYGPLLNNFLI